MEGARDRLSRRRAHAAGGVEVGREGRPTRGAEQRIEVLCGHGATVVSGSRQGVRLQQVTVRLDLPQDALFGRRALVLVFEVDEMETSRLAVEGLDGRDHAAPVADGGEHAGAGDGDGLRRGRG